MFRMKRVNLQHYSYKDVPVSSILDENNVDPDQMASIEASCSGSTVLPKRIQPGFAGQRLCPTRVSPKHNQEA